MLWDEEVFWVVELRVETILYTVDDSGLEIDHAGAWDIVLIIGLVEEDIFAVVTVLSVVFEDALSADSVLHAQLLPELVSNYKYQMIVNL